MSDDNFEYVGFFYLICPVCSSENIQVDHVDGYEDLTICQCLDCGNKDDYEMFEGYREP